MADMFDDFDAFAVLGAMMRAWAATKKLIVDENVGLKLQDAKTFEAHAARLEDSGTMLAFGYIVRAEEKTGRNAIMQAKIVDAIALREELADVEQHRKAQQAVRQDIKRRADALEFFGLIEREYLTSVAVQFSATEVGRKYRTMFVGF